MAGQGQDLKQGVYRTPAEFMAVVRREFPLCFDLAASPENAQAAAFLTEADDSLARSWSAYMPADRGAWLWLNPPYSDINSWARKCAAEMQNGAKILFLVPASVGSDWYADWIHGTAEIRFLRPRLVFDFLYPLDYMDATTRRLNASRALQGLDPVPCPKAGQPNRDPYPKDLMLAIFDLDNPRPKVGYPWRWK